MEKEIYTTSRKRRPNLVIFLVFVAALVLLVSGCNNSKNDTSNVPPVPMPAAEEDAGIRGRNAAPEQNEGKKSEIDVDNKAAQSSRMISYDVESLGRSNPFMPYGEYQAYENAKRSAIAEANAHNAEVARLNSLKGKKIREKDDISPYSFNLPVPPTSLAGEGSTAAKITQTKVVGIMYNKESPSAIINLDNKDYLVRPGDKIIDEKYSVVKINPNWITVSMGANVYSAAIGELFSKEGIETNQTDLYNLKNRFGGRRGYNI